MIDKITVNIGGFAIRPSENDAYNQPIGLAFDNADNGGLDVALAEHGHHQELYRAYLTTLSKTHRRYMPSSYEHAAAAFGFFSNCDIYPVVISIENNNFGAETELAARALFAALEANTLHHLDIDNSMKPVRVRRSQLDAAIIQVGKDY